MPKLTFSTNELPRNLSEAARISAWRDQTEMKFGTKIEAGPRSDVPFHGSIEVVALNSVSLAAMRGSFGNTKRTKAAVVADGSDRSCLVINLAPRVFQARQHGREVAVETGGATLFCEGDVGGFEYASQSDRLILRVPRHVLAGAVRSPEDFAMRPIDPVSEPLRMIKSYAGMLMATGGPADAVTAQSVASHLADLVALALGPTRDARQGAQRGLRAARVNAILVEIGASASDPSFAAHHVAGKLGLSVRYIHDLLHETGQGFGERVLELRLQNANRLLASWQHSHRKITDIAFSSSFNDVSYFNRCFRSRFGVTPSDVRAMARDRARGVAQPAATSLRSIA